MDLRVMVWRKLCFSAVGIGITDLVCEKLVGPYDIRTTTAAAVQCRVPIEVGDRHEVRG